MHIKQLISFGRLFCRSYREFSLDSYYIFLKNHIIRRAKNILQFNGAVKPDILGIETTTYCPWDCKGCYVPIEMRRDKTIIEKNLLLSALPQARKAGIRLCGFMGGEPMRKDTIPLILRAASQNPDLTFVVCTNGEYISRNDVSYFLDVPNVGVLLSFDGFEETNDKIRGKGTYNNTMKAAYQLRQLERVFGASITMRRENVDEVLTVNFTQHLVNQGFIYIAWIKYYATNEENKIFEVEDKELIERLTELRRQTMTWPVFLQTNLVGDFYSFTRKSVHHTIYMRVNGDIHAKRGDMLSSLGNIKQESFKKILTNNSETYASKYYPIII